MLQLFLQFLDQSTAKKLQVTGDTEDAPAQQSAGGPASSPRTVGVSDFNLDFGTSPRTRGHSFGRGNETSLPQGLDYMNDLFSTKEAQDFSMFQLQPDLFGGDIFGGGLDQYYNSVMPRGDSSNDIGFDKV